MEGSFFLSTKKAFLERPIPVSGKVTLNGRPHATTIVIDGMSESLLKWHSAPQYGNYHLFLPDGTPI